MSHDESAASLLPIDPADEAPSSHPRPRPAPSGLSAPRLLALDEDARIATVLLAGVESSAALDASLDPRVLRTALARGERVIVEHDGGEPVVLGVLRTCATPGVDEGDDFVIRARRVAVEGAHEVSLRVGGSSLVMRALGHVEIASKTLVARAEGAQRFFARMIHMN